MAQPLQTSLKLTSLLGLAVLSATSTAQAAGKLTVYCSVQNTTCEQVTKAFAQKYQIETQFIRNSTGTILGKIKSEKENPQADVWYGGTIEPHLQAAELNLLEKYRSPIQKQIMPKFKSLMAQRGDFTSVIYLMEMGIGINTKKLASLGITPPKCFADLTKPEFKNEIQYADPRVSGTGYSLLSTLISLWGEEKTNDYLKALDHNVSQYTKSGLATSYLATGDVAIDIGFMLNYAKEKNKGAPVEGVLPCEGVGYALGAASIIKGARNLDNAKLFVDWALSKEAQELTWQKGEAYSILTNTTAQQSPYALDFKSINLINYDFDKYGATDLRKRLITKWVDEVKLAK